MRKVFYDVARTGEIPAGTGKLVTIGDESNCVLYHTDDGGYFASGALCPHQNEPLDCGHLEGCEVICRAHHLRFDLRNGDCTNAGGFWLRILEVKVEEDRVLVGLWED